MILVLVELCFNVLTEFLNIMWTNLVLKGLIILVLLKVVVDMSVQIISILTKGISFVLCKG